MIYQILHWLFYGLIFYIVCVGCYFILLFLANRKSRKELETEWHKLNLLKKNIEDYKRLSLEELERQKLQDEQLRKAANEGITKLNVKAKENYNQAQENMREAEKIKQAAENKIAIMDTQVRNLQAKLFNARERAKRLANKSQAS